MTIRKWIALQLINFGMWFYEQSDSWVNEDYRVYNLLQLKKKNIMENLNDN